MGGSLGKSKNSSSSKNSFENNVWGPQGDALRRLYDMAFQEFDRGSNQYIENANNVFDTASGNYQNLIDGGSWGDSGKIQDKLFSYMGQPSQMGQMYNSIVGGEGNEYIDPLVDRMRESSAQNVATLQGQNALDAASMGQSGSSRQAMENAMITSQANRDLMNKEAELRAGAYDKDLAMKMGIAQQADTNRQAEQDRLYDMLAGSQASKESAMANSPIMGALAMGGQQAQWNPLNYLVNAIGGPIMESSGSATGGSKGKGFGAGGGLWG